VGKQDVDGSPIGTPEDPPPDRDIPGKPINLMGIVLFAALAVALIMIVTVGQLAVQFGSKAVGFGAVAVFVACLGGGRVWKAGRALRTRRERLAQLRAVTLPDRARHAAEVLQQATRLVEELQAELTARTALLEDVKRQAEQAAKRAGDMEKLSSVDDETTRILNTYFDEALKHRLEVLERVSRQREWFIGTVVAMAVGVIAILCAHYFLGF
jgi:hypothetical protein